MTHVSADDEESATPRQLTPADLKPGTSTRRVNVAMYAHQFFGLIHNPAMAPVSLVSVMGPQLRKPREMEYPTPGP